MYSVSYERSALKVLSRMPANMAALVRSKIVALAVDPFVPNNNVKALRGRDGYRLRVGDWRIIYRVDRGALIIWVIAIGSRGSVYQ